jgi:hypothetical protein
LYFLILFSFGVIGYALVTQLLTITSVSTVTGTWDVRITAVGTPTFTNAANVTTPSVSTDGHTATFSVDLNCPGATAVYPITVKNNGNIPAKLTSITGITDANAAAPTDVTFACNAAVNDTLAAGASIVYNVTVVWASTATTIPSTLTKTATITLNYQQNE